MINLLKSLPWGKSRYPYKSVGVVEVGVKEGIRVVDVPDGSLLAEPCGEMVHKFPYCKASARHNHISKLSKFIYHN